MPPSQPPPAERIRVSAVRAWVAYLRLWRAGRGGIAVALLIPCFACWICGRVATAVLPDAPTPTPRPTNTARPSRTPAPTRTTGPTRTLPPPTETSVPATEVPVPPTAVPALPTEAPPAAPAQGIMSVPQQPVVPPQAAQQSGCIDINTATYGDLMRIIHIAEVRAEEIIQIRGQRRFRSVDDLTWVNGIGPARIRDIKSEGIACVH